MHVFCCKDFLFSRFCSESIHLSSFSPRPPDFNFSLLGLRNERIWGEESWDRTRTCWKDPYLTDDDECTRTSHELVSSHVRTSTRCCLNSLVAGGKSDRRERTRVKERVCLPKLSVKSGKQTDTTLELYLGSWRWRAVLSTLFVLLLWNIFWSKIMMLCLCNGPLLLFHFICSLPPHSWPTPCVCSMCILILPHDASMMTRTNLTKPSPAAGVIGSASGGFIILILIMLILMEW